LDELIESQFQRAEELLNELEDEYGSALNKQEVTTRALNLTHEILMKLRSILDQVMHQYFEKAIAPNLTTIEKERVKIYFPIVGSEESFRLRMGRNKMLRIETDDPKTYDFIKSCQPFAHKGNGWLESLNKYAVEGKHIGLVPQKKQTHEKITIIGPGGRVSWDPKCVEFGKGGTVTIGGALIDPQTQRIVPTPNVEEVIESWVSFTFEGTEINALKLCRECLDNSRDLVKRFADLTNH